MLYKLDHIMNDIEDSIIKEIPFSIIRLGDGDLKILHELKTGKFDSKRWRREGFKKTDRQEILDMYVNACNNANYVSSFEMFLDGTFWRTVEPRRALSEDCVPFIKNWKNFYLELGITNENYCSPEIGWQLFLKRKGKKNLLDILKGKRVCLITCYGKTKQIFIQKGIKISLISIPGRFKNHYSKFDQIKNSIKEICKHTNIFLVGAGAVGRGYSSYIKTIGKIAIDIGKVFDMAAGIKWIPQYRNFVLHYPNELEFRLTTNGEKYGRFF